MKTTLIILCLNEIDGMKVIMPRIHREWCDQILIVDGGSQDGTVEYARQQGYFVHVQQKPGIRQAYLEVLPMIQGDVIITFSPDGNSIPEAIPALIAKMKEGYDMVIASRYLGNAKSDDDDLITGFGNWFFTRFINLLFGGSYTDAMGIYRIYKVSLIKELELDKEKWYSTPEKYFGCLVSWEPLLSARAAKRKLKIAEIPADEPARLGGERKLRIWKWGATFLFQFFRDFILWK